MQIRFLCPITSIIAATLCATQLQAKGVIAADICDLAAQKAAQDSNVPLELLMAISRVETGRKQDGGLQPWPWAINQAGQGHWFDNADQAIAFASEQLAKGQENFDVGCFQINLRWHGENFGSIEEAFEPRHNAAYAARFLTELFQSEGSWPEAVAAYHSRTPEEAGSYLAKVETALTELRASGTAPPAPGDLIAQAKPQTPNVNRFPLLQAGSRGIGASLVPMTDGGLPLFAVEP